MGLRVDRTQIRRDACCAELFMRRALVQRQALTVQLCHLLVFRGSTSKLLSKRAELQEIVARDSAPFFLLFKSLCGLTGHLFEGYLGRLRSKSQSPWMSNFTGRVHPSTKLMSM